MTRYHLIGIAGIGMSALCRLLLQRGDEVSGSDLSKGSAVEALKKLGATIYSFHDSAHIQRAEVVVYSSSIKPTNPEFIEAKRRQLKLQHRSDLLDEFTKGKKPLLVAGAHGKTSTTALLVALLSHSRKDPSFAVGGYLGKDFINASLGKGEEFILEADESDGSFLKTPSYGAIVTNVDIDHLDYWKSKEALWDAYARFIDQVQCKDCLFVCEEDPFLKELSYKGGHTYGLSKAANLRIYDLFHEGFKSQFSLEWNGESLGSFELPMQGKHYVLNATAAIGLALQTGAQLDLIKEGLRSFSGVKRRLEWKGSVEGIDVFDDYAHHPAEIQATLTALKQAFPTRRCVAVFQPHRYSRLECLFKEFSTSFGAAHHCIITDVYAASEMPIIGIDAKALLSVMKHPSAVYFSKEDLIKALLQDVKPQDIVVMMGAGDITECSSQFVSALKESCGSQ